MKNVIAKGENKLQDLSVKIQLLNTESYQQKKELQELNQSLDQTQKTLHESTLNHAKEIYLQKLSLIKQQEAIKALQGRGIFRLLLSFLRYKFPLIPISILVIMISRKYKGIFNSLIMIILILYFQAGQ